MNLTVFECIDNFLLSGKIIFILEDENILFFHGSKFLLLLFSELLLLSSNFNLHMLFDDL